MINQPISLGATGSPVATGVHPDGRLFEAVHPLTEAHPLQRLTGIIRFLS